MSASPFSNIQWTGSASPQINFTETEIAKYSRIFIQADTNKDNHLSAAESKNVLSASGLQKAVLSTIWSIADRKKQGILGRTEFFIACRLIAAAQNNIPVNEATISKPGFNFIAAFPGLTPEIPPMSQREYQIAKNTWTTIQHTLPAVVEVYKNSQQPTDIVKSAILAAQLDRTVDFDHFVYGFYLLLNYKKKPFEIPQPDEFTTLHAQLIPESGVASATPVPAAPAVNLFTATATIPNKASPAPVQAPGVVTPTSQVDSSMEDSINIRISNAQRDAAIAESKAKPTLSKLAFAQGQQAELMDRLSEALAKKARFEAELDTLQTQLEKTLSLNSKIEMMIKNVDFAMNSAAAKVQELNKKVAEMSVPEVEVDTHQLTQAVDELNASLDTAPASAFVPASNEIDLTQLEANLGANPFEQDDDEEEEVVADVNNVPNDLAIEETPAPEENMSPSLHEIDEESNENIHSYSISQSNTGTTNSMSATGADDWMQF